MSTALKKITTAAKSLRRKHPKMTWKAAIKKAGAAYRSKAKPVAKKKVSAKKRTTGKRVGAYRVLEAGEHPNSLAKMYRVKRSGGKFQSFKRIQGVGSVASRIASLKQLLLDELGRLEIRKFQARLKRDKTKIQKLITAKRAQIRRLSTK